MNKARIKGTTFETAVVNYLREHGFIHAERRAQHGNQDRGDIAGVVPFVIECKATKQIDLAGALTEAKAELANDPFAKFHCAVIKRRNHSVATAYVVMELQTFVEVIRDP